LLILSASALATLVLAAHIDEWTREKLEVMMRLFLISNDARGVRCCQERGSYQ
jgi:hypothetical protein